MLGLFFGFNGRINRVTYWLGSIIAGFIGFLGIFLGIMLAGGQAVDKSPEAMMRALSTMGLIVGPVMLAMGWAGLALQAKRFHDRGRSGVLVLLPMAPTMLVFTAIVGGAMANKPFQQVAAECQIYINILWLINLAFFVDLGCLPGKEGPNKYGDPPNGGFGLGRASPSAPAPGGGPAAERGLAFLGGADKAMERAIAERASTAAQPQPRYAAALVARPGMGAAASGFGRKPAR